MQTKTDKRLEEITNTIINRSKKVAIFTSNA